MYSKIHQLKADKLSKRQVAKKLNIFIILKEYNVNQLIK